MSRTDQTFSGDQIVFGSALFVAIAMGCMGIYVTSVAKLPEIYQISITQLGTFGTLMSITCMAGSMMLVTVRKKLGSRGCLYLGSAAMFIQALAVLFLKGNLISLFVELIACGLVASISAQAVLSGIISNWFAEKRAQKIAMMLGAAPFGSALYQFLAGQLLNRMNYFLAVGGLSLINGTLMFLLIRFVIIAERPEDVHQKAYGSSDITDAAGLKTVKSSQTAESSQAAKSSQATGPSQTADFSKAAESSTPSATVSRSLYQKPTFWFLVIATMLAAGNTTYVLNYATMFFTGFGMSIGTAAALLSLMSVGSGIFSFASGKLLSKLKIRRFLCLLIAATVMANLGMVLYSKTGLVPVIVLIILCYGAGGLIPTVANLISGDLFEQKDGVNAASKCYAAYAGTNIVLAPTCAAIIDHAGFSAAYCFIAALCGCSLIFYMLAIRFRNR